MLASNGLWQWPCHKPAAAPRSHEADCDAHAPSAVPTGMLVLAVLKAALAPSAVVTLSSAFEPVMHTQLLSNGHAQRPCACWHGHATAHPPAALHGTLSVVVMLPVGDLDPVSTRLGLRAIERVQQRQALVLQLVHASVAHGTATACAVPRPLTRPRSPRW